MVLNHSHSSNLEHLALKELTDLLFHSFHSVLFRRHCQFTYNHSTIHANFCFDT